jgi:transposase
MSLDLSTDQCYHRLVLKRQAYRYRLSPTRREAALLRQCLGCSRFVWNAILAENEFRYAAGDPLKIGRASFGERLVFLKKKHVFLRQAHSQPLQQSHVSRDNRLTQADFLCVKCGHTANADTNAAINILGRAG